MKRGSPYPASQYVTNKKPRLARQNAVMFRYKPRRPEARALASQTAMVAASRRIGQSENKCTQYNFAHQVSNTGVVLNLYSNMSQGTGPLDNYLGNEILPTSIRMNLSITMGPLAGVGDGTNVCRVIIFQWLDASAPVLGGVLASPSDPHSFLLWNNTENVRVLSDKLYALSQVTAAAGYDALCDKVYIKGKKIMPTKFDQHGAGTTQKGGLYVAILSDSAVAPAPYFQASFQVTYTDK